MPAVSHYEAMILQSRVAELQILADNQRDVMAVLSKEYKRIQVSLDNLELTDKLKYSQLINIQTELDKVMDDVYGKTGVWQGRKIALGGELEGVIADGMDKAATAGIEGKTKASVALLNDVNPSLAQYTPPLFGGIREDVLRVLMTRPRMDGKIFSERFWNLKGEADRVISQTVSSGILQGKSARLIAQDLRPYLNYREGMTQKQVISRTMTLARTEINNAFTECQIQAAKREPWNKGIKWNLSASHPRPDICDIYASQDLFGLGAGVYPPDDVPVRHPRCLCFLTNILASLEEVAAMLREDMGLDVPREQITVKGTTNLNFKGVKKINRSKEVTDGGTVFKHYQYGEANVYIEDSLSDEIKSKVEQAITSVKPEHLIRKYSTIPGSGKEARASQPLKFYLYSGKPKGGSEYGVYDGLEATISIFKSESKLQNIEGTLIHEIGHNVNWSNFVETTGEERFLITGWKPALLKDGKNITGYGTLDNAEEAFAEAYSKYYSLGKVTAEKSDEVLPNVTKFFDEAAFLGKTKTKGNKTWLLNQ